MCVLSPLTWVMLNTFLQVSHKFVFLGFSKGLFPPFWRAGKGQEFCCVAQWSASPPLQIEVQFSIVTSICAFSKGSHSSSVAAVQVSWHEFLNGQKLPVMWIAFCRPEAPTDLSPERERNQKISLCTKVQALECYLLQGNLVIRTQLTGQRVTLTARRILEQLADQSHAPSPHSTNEVTPCRICCRSCWFFSGPYSWQYLAYTFTGIPRKTFSLFSEKIPIMYEFGQNSPCLKLSKNSYKGHLVV